MKRLKPVLSLCLALLLLSGCGLSSLFHAPPPSGTPVSPGGPSGTPAPTDSAAPSPSPTPPPIAPPADANQGSVYTDWSKLTGYTKPQEIYTRLQAGPMETLTPSDSYGMLLPYAGSVVLSADQYAMTGYLYGLVTERGCIVMDANCISISPIYPPYTYTDLGAVTSLHIYVLQRIVPNPDASGDGGQYISKYALCALNGGWVTPFDYSDVFACSAGAICVRDGETNDFQIIDKNNSVVFDMANFPAADQLASYTYYGFTMFGTNKWFPLALKDGNTAYFDVTGDRLSSDSCDGYFDAANDFVCGYAAVCKNGLWGIIDEEGNYVYPPEYGGATVCAQTLTDGSRIPFAFILNDNGASTYRAVDMSGATRISKAQELYWSDNGGNGSFFDVWDDNGDHRYYDANFQPITVNGSASGLNSLWDGTFYIIENDGCRVVKGGQEYFVPGAAVIDWVDYGLIAYNDAQGSAYVQTQEGTPVASSPAPPNGGCASINETQDILTGKTYLLRSSRSDTNLYDVLDAASGKLLLTGADWTYYLPMDGLFSCQEGNLHGYKTVDNQWVFCVYVDPQD